MPPFSFLKIAFMLVGQYHCLCLVCSMMFVRSEVVIAVLINGPGKKKKSYVMLAVVFISEE